MTPKLFLQQKKILEKENLNIILNPERETLLVYLDQTKEKDQKTMISRPRPFLIFSDQTALTKIQSFLEQKAFFFFTTSKELFIHPESESQFLGLWFNDLNKGNINLLKEVSKNEMIQTQLEFLLHYQQEIETKLSILYRKKIPLRLDRLRPLTLFSKFNAGILEGGEFFDYFQKHHHLYFFLSSADSYENNQKALDLYLLLGEKIDLMHLKQEIFLSTLYEELNVDCLDGLNIILAKFSLKGLQFEYFSNNSNFYFIRNNTFNQISIHKDISITLSLGETLYFLSPGVSKNIKNLNKNLDDKFNTKLNNICSLLTQTTDHHAAISKSFFEIIEDSPPSHDLFILGIEVDKKGLYELI